MHPDHAVTSVDAIKVTLDHPGDVSELRRLAVAGRFDPDRVIAVTGKTEGTGPGETTRIEADRAIRGLLEELGTRPAAEIDRIPMVFTSGGVGILTPHVVVFFACEAVPAPAGQSRLAIGVARSAVMQPEWTGRTQVVLENAATIRRAVDAAGLTVDEVEYVVGKAYHVPESELQDARAAGRDVLDLDANRLFRVTSGSAGLGVAVALDGVTPPSADRIARDFDQWSGRASFSANPWEPVGGEGPHTQVIAMGNRAGGGGRLRIGHAVIRDLLDVAAFTRALRRAGLDVGDGPLTPAQSACVIAVYVKAGPGPDALLRGRRQVVDNGNYGNEVKAAVAGMFAGMLQDNVMYISGSATHQGPPGGGTLAVIVDVDQASALV